MTSCHGYTVPLAVTPRATCIGSKVVAVTAGAAAAATGACERVDALRNTRMSTASSATVHGDGRQHATAT